MKILVDSNILVRQCQKGTPQCQLAVDATAKLRIAKDQLCIVPQNIYEFWTVVSRPINVNGLGFPFARVKKEVADIMQLFQMLDETPAVFTEWERLIGIHAIVGKNVHDAHLVAAMIVNNISHVLTFNKQDFQRFTNITVQTPAEVMAMP